MTVHLLDIAVAASAIALVPVSIKANEPHLVFGRPKTLKRGSPGPKTGQHRTQHVEVVRDGEILCGWLTKPRDREAANLAFYMGGRNEDVRWAEDIATWLGADWAVCTFAYRGRNGSSGVPTERACIEDALEQLTWLSEIFGDKYNDPKTKVTIIGRSIGASLAVLVANELPSSVALENLVLISPPLGLSALAQRVPLLPTLLLPLINTRLDCYKVAGRVKANALVLMAEHDNRVPRGHSAALGTLLGGRTTIKTIDGTDHKTLPRSTGALQAVAEFLATDVEPVETTSPRPGPAPQYKVERSGMPGDRHATQDEVEDFLDACGIKPESDEWEAALAGVPIAVDGASMKFTPVPVAAG